MSGFEDIDDEGLEFLIEVQKKHKEIKRLRKAGKTAPEIAKSIGWKLQTVEVVVNNQINARKVYIKNRRITPKGIEKILALHTEGSTQKIIAKIIRCSPSSVSRIIKKHEKTI